MKRKRFVAAFLLATSMFCNLNQTVRASESVVSEEAYEADTEMAVTVDGSVSLETEPESDTNKVDIKERIKETEEKTQIYYKEPAEDEYEYLSEERIGEFDEDEYRKNLTSQKVDSLTQQQIDEGWVLINGYAYPPNNLTGEMGEVLRGEDTIPSESVGYVTFVANCDPEIKEPIYIEIMDVENYEIFAYDLYYASDYTKTVRVPAGAYVINSGGIMDDTTARYTVSQSTFTIAVDETKTVAFKVTDRKKNIEKAEAQIIEIEEETEEETTVPIVSEEENSSKEGRMIYLLIGSVLLVIAVVIIVICTKKMKEIEENSL